MQDVPLQQDTYSNYRVLQELGIVLSRVYDDLTDMTECSAPRLVLPSACVIS